MADSEVLEDDTFSILLATDNHLGYSERDVIRGNDGLTTFEEILQIATQKNVDFILLGGDLFHENKPSRKCLHGCFELLRKYCMGDRPIQFEFLSDQSVNFKHNKFPVVNYEDPNLNISIPVFSIHGNHDDPAGAGSYCALDILSIVGVVNYFGKCTELNNIQISPLLMQKGSTKLALYGLGSIRDERLHNLFNQGNVSMLRPREDSEDWFNMFVIHQNRAQHGATNFIPPNFLDDFLDLVIWGHEHECRLTPEYFECADHKGFYISQPGSSIATSLSPGEATQKHVGLLEIKKKSFKITNIPLMTVRPFYVENVNLSASGLDPECPDITKNVMEYCMEKVDALLEKAQLERLDRNTPDKPLIRLKVEYTDTNEMFNKHSFGQHYVNKVANPRDIILFNKKRTATSKKENDFDKEQFQEIFDAASIDQSRVEDLVNDYFDSTEGELQLSLLSETGLSYSVKEFVDKEENLSIDNLVQHQLQKVKTHLKPLEISMHSIDDEIKRFTEERKQNQELEKKEIETVLSANRSKKTSEGARDDLLSEDDMEQDESVSGRGSRGRGSRARGRARGARGGRGRKKKGEHDDDNDGSDNEDPTIMQSGKGNRGRGRSSRARGGSPRVRGAKAVKNTIDVSFKKRAKNGTGSSKTTGITFSSDTDSDSDEDLFPSKQSKTSKRQNDLNFVSDTE